MSLPPPLPETLWWLSVRCRSTETPQWLLSFFPPTQKGCDGYRFAVGALKNMSAFPPLPETQWWQSVRCRSTRTSGSWCGRRLKRRFLPSIFSWVQKKTQFATNSPLLLSPTSSESSPWRSAMMLLLLLFFVADFNSLQFDLSWLLSLIPLILTIDVFYFYSSKNNHSAAMGLGIYHPSPTSPHPSPSFLSLHTDCGVRGRRHGAFDQFASVRRSWCAEERPGNVGPHVARSSSQNGHSSPGRHHPGPPDAQKRISR